MCIILCRLFMDSAKLFGPFVAIQLISMAPCLAIALYYLDLVRQTLKSFLIILIISKLLILMWLFQQMHHIDFILVTIFLIILVSSMIPFCYCYFGQIATESFEKMSNCLYDINWYDLPLDLQKYFIIMIANTQKPVYYHGFGMVKADLNTFITVSFNQ